MAAMATVPREAFVPESHRLLAFANGPVPIGHGQTISQPYIVALMTDLLPPRPRQHSRNRHRLGLPGRRAGGTRGPVYSVEIIAALATAAANAWRGSAATT